MKELAKIAATSLGLEPCSCTGVQKLQEGNYNKAFLLTMNNGDEVVAKVRNPNAGFALYTTASEVATMDFVNRPDSPSALSSH